jgi:hypothetical protein
MPFLVDDNATMRRWVIVESPLTVALRAFV